METIFLHDTPTLLAMISGIVMIAAIAGLLAGLLGIGGGIVLVPGLLMLFQTLGFDGDKVMHVALGTSLAVIIPTGFSSTRAHWRRESVRKDLLKTIGPGIIFGVLCGTLLADQLDSASLIIIFAVAILFLALFMISPTDKIISLSNIPKQPTPFVAGAGIGTLSALMGIGGATISVPFMTLCRVPIHQAIGTASALGLIIAIPATIGYILTGLGEMGKPPLSFGYINVMAWALIVPISVLCAPLGASLAHKLPVRLLKHVFAAFMMIVAIRMIYGIMA